MTAIAGFCEGGKVWIGGDSAGVSGYDLCVRSDPKVFVKGEFAFGFTTSFRMGQLIRYSLTIPEKPFGVTNHEYMATLFVDALRKCLKDGGFAVKDKEREEGGQFLVGYRSKLYLIDYDYQVMEPDDIYAACGCGAQVVRGALFAVFALRNVMSGRDAVLLALKAAERCSTGVRGPFSIVSVP